MAEIALPVAAFGGAWDKSSGKKGYGLADPKQAGQFQPYTTGGGLRRAEDDPYAGQRFQQYGGGIQTPYGWDMSSPGVAEQYFQGTAGRFMAPGAAMQQYGQQQGQYGKETAGEEYYGSVKGQAGQKSASEALYGKDPGLGGYYDRAKERSAGSINDQLAARGVYGTSAGVDQLGQAMTDLDAQRANREADYTAALANQADAQRMNRLGMFGDLAFRSGDAMLNRLGQGMSAASMADAADLARLNTGMSSAMGAQDARRQRVQDYFSNMSGMGGTLGGMNQMGLSQLLGLDQELLGGILSSALGLGHFGYEADQREKAQHREDINMVWDMIQGGMSMGAK